VQVLNEAASVCLRKLKLPWSEVRELLDAVKACCEVVPLTLPIHERALPSSTVTLASACFC
jgi:predicted nucleic acid-binding protein